MLIPESVPEVALLRVKVCGALVEPSEIRPKLKVGGVSVTCPGGGGGGGPFGPTPKASQCPVAAKANVKLRE